MRNITARPASDEDFFKRTKLINRIYRRLDVGDDIFLAAPRRVGKTSIMWHLKDFPRENYYFIYVIVESVRDTETFYYKLWDALAQSNIQSFLAKFSKKTQIFFSTALDRIRGIGIPIIGGKIELNPSAKSSYQSEFERLLKSINTNGRKIVFMIDEFPQAIDNIKNDQGKAKALQFLQLCREQRQIQNDVIFIYTGSIGLRAVVRSIANVAVINDLSVIEVPPLSIVDATTMATLILDQYKIIYENDVIPYLLEKIKWLIPFHIQLAVRELIDIYENEERSIIKSDVDKAFSHLLNIRNTQYFAQYATRLRERYSPSTFEQIKKLLNYVAINDQISPKKAYQLIADKLEEEDYEKIIEELQFDGYLYLNEEKGIYYFPSRLVQMWWKKFIVK